VTPATDRRERVKWSELAVPIIIVGAWILLQLVVLPRLGVST
jgi:hypothetical protein